MESTIRNLVLFFPGWLFALCVHEFAHAWVADRLGDDTPRKQGRLTLAPGSHIDLFGSIVLPALGLTMGGWFFGWAKPVMINPSRLRGRLSEWQGHALVALAGPMSNVLLGFLSGGILTVLILNGGDPGGFAARALIWSLQANALLAVFNLLPLPPLDGSRLIPDSMSDVRDFLNRYSMLIFIGLFFLPIFNNRTLGGIVIHPMIEWLAHSFLSFASF